MIEYLKEEIQKIDNNIAELNEKRSKISVTTVVEPIFVGMRDSDLGVKVPVDTGEKRVFNRGEREQQLIDSQIRALYARKKELETQLDALMQQNLEQEKEKWERLNETEEKEQLEKERLEHEKRFEDFDKLLVYLRRAGMYDLASQLSGMRFAYMKKDSYIYEEIDLRSKEKAFETKTQTTPKEYREIKRSVISLTKEATRMAKKYRDLYNLYLSATDIVRDIQRKDIPIEHDDLKKYFEQPTGSYYISSTSDYRERPNLGYELLAFYRDSDSKYNEAVRRHRI